MATIFYHQDTGNIYGVHHNSSIEVPDGLALIDVAEPPDKINWPQLPDGRPGNEHTSRVVGGSLAVNPDALPLPDDNAALDTAIDGAGTLAALKAVLKGQVQSRRSL